MSLRFIEIEDIRDFAGWKVGQRNKVKGIIKRAYDSQYISKAEYDILRNQKDEYEVPSLYTASNYEIVGGSQSCKPSNKLDKYCDSKKKNSIVEEVLKKEGLYLAYCEICEDDGTLTYTDLHLVTGGLREDYAKKKQRSGQKVIKMVAEILLSIKS